jgi:hypothetical protein
MSTRLRIYAVAAFFVALSYLCNHVIDEQVRRFIGGGLVVASVLVLEWIIRTLERSEHQRGYISGLQWARNRLRQADEPDGH